MSTVRGREGLYRAWFSEIGSDRPTYGPVATRLNQLVQETPAEGWDFIVGLVQAADDEQLGWVATGPLEDLLWWHGLGFIDQVEARATCDARFKECLAHVCDEGMDPVVCSRIHAATKGTPA